jgi:hypothetical protein
MLGNGQRGGLEGMRNALHSASSIASAMGRAGSRANGAGQARDVLHSASAVAAKVADTARAEPVLGLVLAGAVGYLLGLRRRP